MFLRDEPHCSRCTSLFRCCLSGLGGVGWAPTPVLRWSGAEFSQSPEGSEVPHQAIVPPSMAKSAPVTPLSLGRSEIDRRISYVVRLSKPLYHEFLEHGFVPRLVLHQLESLVRLYRPGRDGIGPDIGGATFHCQLFGHRNNTALGCHVSYSGQGLVSLFPRDGSDINNGRAPRFLLKGAEAARVMLKTESSSSEMVRSQSSSVTVSIELRVGHSRIVHENIESPEFRRNEIDQFRHSDSVREVARMKRSKIMIYSFFTSDLLGFF